MLGWFTLHCQVQLHLEKWPHDTAERRLTRKMTWAIIHEVAQRPIYCRHMLICVCMCQGHEAEWNDEECVCKLLSWLWQDRNLSRRYNLECVTFPYITTSQTAACSRDASTSTHTVDLCSLCLPPYSQERPNIKYVLSNCFPSCKNI